MTRVGQELSRPAGIDGVVEDARRHAVEYRSIARFEDADSRRHRTLQLRSRGSASRESAALDHALGHEPLHEAMAEATHACRNSMRTPRSMPLPVVLAAGAYLTRSSFMMRPATFQSWTYRLPSLSQDEPCVPLKIPSIHSSW